MEPLPGCSQSRLLRAVLLAQCPDSKRNQFINRTNMPAPDFLLQHLFGLGFDFHRHTSNLASSDRQDRSISAIANLEDLTVLSKLSTDEEEQRRYHTHMGATTLISVEDYLRTSYRPDCDFVEGEILERNVGKTKHGFAQFEIGAWIRARKDLLRLQPLTEVRMRVAAGKFRIPDVLVCEIPVPDEQVFTEPPYLCVEVMSPEDTISSMQDRLDDYIQFGVPNIWVIDPWKHRGWSITANGWAAQPDTMRTADGRIVMPLADVLLP